MKMNKSYKQLLFFKTFEERFDYLNLHGSVGEATFGFERYLNQSFYASKEWRRIRRNVIIRDNGCDLGIQDREILDKIFIHHINPITIDDIENASDCVFDLNNLICCSFDTHNAIHYGDINLLPTLPIERKKGDTCPWKVF